MILLKLNNDRHNLHTFIEDIETKVFYILYTSFYIDSRLISYFYNKYYIKYKIAYNKCLLLLFCYFYLVESFLPIQELK